MGAFKSEYEPQFFSAYQHVTPTKGTPCELLDGKTFFGGTQVSRITQDLMWLGPVERIEVMKCLRIQNIWTEEKVIEFLNEYNEAKDKHGTMQGFLGNSLVCVGILGVLISFRNRY